MRQLRGLNKSQLSAVQHESGPAIVVAGAGTGKTAVLTLRIANLILQKKIAQNQILALTFTEKAATEMQERVELLLPYGYIESEISTFHSLGDKILRAHSLELGISSDFVIMSNFAQAVFISDLLENLAGNLKHYRPLGNPRRFVGSISKFISRLKDEAISAEDFAKFVASIKKKPDISVEEYRRQKELSRIYTAYQTESRKRGLLDYGDQLLLVLDLFNRHPDVLKEYQDKYSYIMVDEFQDTNFAQFEIVRLMSQKHHNVMVVGDDDQSIYRFRGAAITNILSFEEVFPKATRIVLQQNYRSGQKILDSAYKLIQYNNPYRLEKKYRINKRLKAQKTGRKPVCHIADSLVEEIEYVSNQIKQLRKQGYKYKDMAILLRKNNQARVVAHGLAVKLVEKDWPL